MGYIVASILIWAATSVLFFRKELLGRQEQEKQELPENTLMGATHDVFRIDEEIVEDGIAMGTALSEDDFEMEYDSVEVEINDIIADNGDDDNDITQEGSIIGFTEMQQMVAVVEGEAPLSDFNDNGLEGVKRSINQITDTDFFEKMIQTKDDISRRIDDILNNINCQ
jgi:hypothetical protein